MSLCVGGQRLRCSGAVWQRRVPRLSPEPQRCVPWRRSDEGMPAPQGGVPPPKAMNNSVSKGATD